MGISEYPRLMIATKLRGESGNSYMRCEALLQLDHSQLKPTIGRILPVLLIFAVLAIPIPRVNAVSGTILLVSPSTNNGVPGGAVFTVSVEIANVTNLVSYDVTLQWNPTVLKPVNISDAGTLFQTLPHFPLLLTTGLGFARAASTLLGTSVNVTGSSTPSLFHVKLAFIAFGHTPLSITSDTLVNTSLIAIPHTDINGFATTPPPAQASLVHWKAKPDFHHLSLSASGGKNTLFADVSDTSGTLPAFVRVIFTVVSATGDVNFAVTSTTFLAASQESILSAVWSAPSLLPINYAVVAQLQVSSEEHTSE